jgi:4-phytase/acid phosphatase
LSNTRFTMILACCAVLASQGMLAQTHNRLSTTNSAGMRLKMVVILSRHGVRSPTWTKARLNAYSAQPWPSWTVPPSELTPRGFQLLQRFGSYDRASLAAAGLLTPSGCSDAPATYIWADTDQRTLASGRALATGLFPGCTTEVHSLPADETDPLFHPASRGVSTAQADAAFEELTQRVAQRTGHEDKRLITEMQRVLLGCAPRAGACAQQPATKPRLLDISGNAFQNLPITVTRGQGDHIVDLKGPLPLASSFSEDFLLEYADAMPVADIGWGKVDEPQLRRFLALHTLYFDLVHRTPALARLENSNLLAHIERTLQQGVESQPVAGALGSPTDKLVLLVGHDTNIAGIASLLGLHWNLDGRTDDTPPGTQLAFELWQAASGRYLVRISITVQTLHQMRDSRDLTFASPPAHQIVRPLRCKAEGNSCSWLVFRNLAAFTRPPAAAMHP